MDVHGRIRGIIESARSGAVRSVNTAQVISNWLIGREIVEEEQEGNQRASYGDRLIETLAERLRNEYGPGYGVINLKLFKRFYLIYEVLLGARKGYATRNLFMGEGDACESIQGLPDSRSWRPGLLHPNLSWTHYRTLLKADEPGRRSFYEIEAIKNCWSARELERQMASLLYERLAKSRDKSGLMRLAAVGHEIQGPLDVFKDPVVIEFLGLPESHLLTESQLEQALIASLQKFLLELGKGFAFVSRQERVTLDGDHFYIDLVFYHAVLKCFVLIELKTGKLTHQDLGQLQLYVNYFDRERRTQGDGPTLGLILCADKNDAVVRYTLGGEQRKTIFASRYKLHLPSEAELRAELRREVVEFSRTTRRA